MTTRSERRLYAGAPGALRTETLFYDDAYGYNFVDQVDVARPSGGFTRTRTPVPVDTTRWLVGLVQNDIVSDGGVGYRITLNSYNDRGLLETRTRPMQLREAGAGVEAFAVETWTYDAFGNVRSYTDAGEHTEYYCYDGDGQFEDGSGCSGGTSQTHTVRTAVKDRLGEVSAFARDLGTGATQQETRFNGDVVELGLDPFQREVSRTVTPAGGTATLRETRTYFDGTANPAGRPHREVFREVGDAAGTVVRTAEYLDAFGNVARRVTGAPLSSATPYIGVGMEHDWAGRTTRETYPQPCADADCPDVLAATEATDTLYDALGRPLTRTTPDGIEAFAYGATTRTPPVGPGPGGSFDLVVEKDRNGNLVRRIVDGDRAVWVEECGSAVSPGATDPGLSCGSPDTTFYVHEPTGEVAGGYVGNNPLANVDPNGRIYGSGFLALAIAIMFLQYGGDTAADMAIRDQNLWRPGVDPIGDSRDGAPVPPGFLAPGLLPPALAPRLGALGAPAAVVGSGGPLAKQPLSQAEREETGRELIEFVRDLPDIAFQMEEGMQAQKEIEDTALQISGLLLYGIATIRLLLTVRGQNPRRRKLDLSEITHDRALELGGFDPVEPEGWPRDLGTQIILEEEIVKIKEAARLKE